MLYSFGPKTAPARASKSQLDKYLRMLDYCRKNSVKMPPQLDGGFSLWCVVRIQSWWRMTSRRRYHLYRHRPTYQIAAIIIQSAWRSLLYYHANNKSKHFQSQGPGSRQRCALSIQTCWRSYCSRRIFRYFSTLICHKLKGAPADLLRAIIPNESTLLDRAAGVHVRFRLGGAMFPPQIYFKIFTHRPLCDVNAFAPRDYILEKDIDAYQVNNNDKVAIPNKAKMNAIRVGASYFGTKVATTGSTKTWYKRDERNPWRPISSVVFENIMEPPWARAPVLEKKPAPFHFSTYTRREAAMREKKRRKREWMLKAFMLARGEEVTRGSVEMKMEELFASSQTELAEFMNGSKHTKKEETGYITYDNPDDFSHERIGSEASNPNPNANLYDGDFNDEMTWPMVESKPHNRLGFDMPQGQSDVGLSPRADNELLKWSLALDFDDYNESWKSIGVSSSSHKK